ncbi:MAG: NAD(P)H-hydrate epimerase, partial [Anaerolineae bacterium]
MEGEKVVSATEMARLEKLSYAKGSSDRAFMDNAGRSLADIVEEFVMQHHLVKSVALLAGKGNNGGDAFAAGRFLLEKKFVVVACHIFPIDTCSPLCREQYEAFQKAGGRV